MITKQSNTFIVTAFFIIISSFQTYAAIDTKSFYQNILSMYKWNIYLPALDLLENHQKATYRRELFKAIGYQKTNQLHKALNSYKNALALNHNANSVKKRIKILQAKIEIGQEISSINSPYEKANFLIGLAKSVINKQPDLAYRYFIQAYEYNTDLDKNDNGMISDAIVFYKANMKKKHRFPKLFHAIFLQIQGDNRVANLKLNEVLYRKDIPEHLKRLANRFLQKGEKIEFARQLALKQERQKQERVKKSKKAKIIKPTKPEINPISMPMVTSKGSSSKLSSSTQEDLNREAEKMLEQLEENPSPNEQIRIIRALGNLKIQNSSVMAKLVELLTSSNSNTQKSKVLESIWKIGGSTAKKAIPHILPLITKKHFKIRYRAMRALSSLRSMPNKIIPAFINEYKNSKNYYEERLVYQYIVDFGPTAIPTLYSMVKTAASSDKRTVAKVLSKLTNRDIEEILND